LSRSVSQLLLRWVSVGLEDIQREELAGSLRVSLVEREYTVRGSCWQCTDMELGVCRLC